MRNITKALTVVSLLTPVSGHSLGIGDIRVRSALNQNLNAEIALVASKGEKPSNIKVNIAPAEKFDEAGVPWTYFLSKIRFQTVVKPSGAMVIKVTSREALKEPYLNFLLEVSWPKGNLYREFTVLVDPPAEYQQPAYQEPSYRYEEPSYSVAERYDNYPRRKQEYAPRPRPVRHAPKVRSNASGVYGGKVVTRRNDTLWKVAARVRGGGVSVEQMMMSLYDNNPHAFYQQNVNALSAGKTLKIPDKNTVEQMSRQSALDEFARHNAAWNNNRSGVPGGATQVAKEESVDSQLKLEAPSESTVAGNETVAPSSEQAAGTKGKSAKASEQPTSAADVSPKENTSAPVDEALQSKVAALEKQMAMMQELIALKDKQLAELQKSGQTTPAQAQNITPETQITTPAQVKPEPVAPVEPVKPVQEQPAQAGPVVPKPSVQPVQTPKPPVKPAPKSVAPKPVPQQEPDSLLPWILGGLGAILLPLFGWLWWQKKKIIQETEAESMFRSYSAMRTGDSSGPLTTIARKTSSGALSAESSFLNDFKASDFESFESFNVDHGDIDPIEEADVYLAYGRYQQAEDLIRQAIKSNPEREECKIKLLEIFHASSNKEDFENYAMELAASGKQEDKDFWRKVTELSKDICPDSALFSTPIPSTVAVFPTESEEHAETVLFDSTMSEHEEAEKPSEENGNFGVAHFEVSDDDTGKALFDLPASSDSAQLELEAVKSELPKEQPSTPSSEGKKDNLLDFELESFEDSFVTTQDNEVLDFDLGPYPGSSQKQEVESLPLSVESKVEVVTEKKDAAATLAVKDDIETYEFDFSFDKTDKKEPHILDKLSEDDLKPETIDRWEPEQTIDFSVENLAETEPEKEDSDAIDFSFDFEPTLVSSSKPTYQEQDFGVSDLTDMDEMETKLDLAKAYIDMGDVESAKDIIGQVIAKGSEEQKKTAQTLLDDINIG